MSNLFLKLTTVMEQKSTSILKSALLSGVYFGIVLILTNVIFYVTGNPFSKVAQYLAYPIMIGGIALAQISYKKQLGGTMSYGQALGVGILAMVFASFISGLYTFVLYTFIDPSLQEQLRLFTEEQLVQQGNIPEEQLDKIVEISTKFQKPIFMFVMAIFSGAFMGTIISLITAIFTKKNPTDEVPE